MAQSLALLLGLIALPAAAADHPLLTDHTGIRWVFPFNTARRTAADAKRLLLIKPVAFGTSMDGGW